MKKPLGSQRSLSSDPHRHQLHELDERQQELTVLREEFGARAAAERGRLRDNSGTFSSSVVLLSDKHPIDITIGQELPPPFHYAWVILPLDFNAH